MFCIKSRERDRDAAKSSFLILTRMGFKTGESLAILGLRKARVLEWLKTDADFCEVIKSIPNFGAKQGGQDDCL